MILGNANRFKGVGYVCFLDILGFSQDILTNWHSPTSNPLDQLLAIKSALPVSKIEKSESPSDTGWRQYACRVNTVSDSITVAFGLEPRLIIGDLVLGLEVMMSNIMAVWASAIEHGYTLRGAIDFGDIYWDENELIGPAFIHAYRLESEIARVSRVLVSSRINKILSDISLGQTGEFIDHLLANFRRDIDGYVIADPRKLGRSAEERTVLAEKVRQIAERAPSSLLKEKYASLISMLRDESAATVTPEDLGHY